LLDEAGLPLQPLTNKGTVMGRGSHLGENGMVGLRSRLYGAITLGAAFALIFSFSPPWVRQARASGPTTADSVTITFENRMETFLPSGKGPVAGASDRYLNLLPESSPLLPAVASRPPARPSHSETLRASGKVLVAGGVGKRGVVFSAELYEPATDTWLARSQLSTGRGQSSTALPNNGRVLVWWGIVVPF
jgi:hypothetical protein